MVDFSCVYAVKVTVKQLHVIMQDGFQIITLGLVNKMLFHDNLTFKYWQFFHLVLMFSHSLKATARKSELYLDIRNKN